MADVHIHPKAIVFEKGKTLEKRKGIDGLPQKLYFSQLSDPNEFPKVRKIWVGHPAIARTIVRFLNWLNTWKSRRD